MIYLWSGRKFICIYSNIKIKIRICFDLMIFFFFFYQQVAVIYLGEGGGGGGENLFMFTLISRLKK